MDHDNEIQPDGETNWVANTDIGQLVWNVEQAMLELRDTLVLHDIPSEYDQGEQNDD